MPDAGNFIRTLVAAATGRFDEPFLIEPGGETRTYYEVFGLAARVATAMRTLGVAPGDRVVVCVDKSPDVVVVYLACLHVGAVHVPLNPAFTADEIGYFIDDSAPTLVVTNDSIDELVDGASDLIPAPVFDCDGDQLAALLYTSGTTGRPKGAALTHNNIRHNAWALHDSWAFDPRDHLVHTLPLFHVHGLFVALHCAMLSAIPVTFLRRFDVDATLSALANATVLMGVPTHYNRLLGDDRFDGPLTKSMRLFTCGSAPLPDAVFNEFTERTGHRICERYGMSEAGIMTSNPYDGDRVPGTVGFPLPGVEIRICTDAGDPVAVGHVGVVEVRGPHLFAGYWQRPDDTAAAHRADGWFISGDVGSIDAEGRVTLQGRSGDMIISGGENIYPKEIEILLDQTNGIVESAVIGVPHADFGEAVVAVLVVAASFDASGLEPILHESLARFKHPKATIVVDELPRNSMGKVQKNRLRERYATHFTA